MARLWRVRGVAALVMILGLSQFVITLWWLIDGKWIVIENALSGSLPYEEKETNFTRYTDDESGKERVVPVVPSFAIGTFGYYIRDRYVSKGAHERYAAESTCGRSGNGIHAYYSIIVCSAAFTAAASFLILFGAGLRLTANDPTGALPQLALSYQEPTASSTMSTSMDDLDTDEDDEVTPNRASSPFAMSVSPAPKEADDSRGKGAGPSSPFATPHVQVQSPSTNPSPSPHDASQVVIVVPSSPRAAPNPAPNPLNQTTASAVSTTLSPSPHSNTGHPGIIIEAPEFIQIRKSNARAAAKRARRTVYRAAIPTVVSVLFNFITFVLAVSFTRSFLCCGESAFTVYPEMLAIRTRQMVPDTVPVDDIIGRIVVKSGSADILVIVAFLIALLNLGALPLWRRTSSRFAKYYEMTKPFHLVDLDGEAGPLTKATVAAHNREVKPKTPLGANRSAFIAMDRSVEPAALEATKPPPKEGPAKEVPNGLHVSSGAAEPPSALSVSVEPHAPHAEQARESHPLPLLTGPQPKRRAVPRTPKPILIASPTSTLHFHESGPPPIVADHSLSMSRTF